MSIFSPLTLAIALKYSFNSKAHKFAAFVAILSVLGIALGVGALIVDTSIMQGLQNRLKSSVLQSTPHIVVNAPYAKASELLEIKNVEAAAPYVEGQALLQSSKSLSLITLAGLDESRILLKDNLPFSKLKLIYIPERGSFKLNAQAAIYLENELSLNTKVRVISTKNARYTPLGLTPSQRLFTLTNYFPSTNSNALSMAVGNYDDVRRLFRLNEDATSIRLWVSDPFLIDNVTAALDNKGYSYTTWKDTQGEFFKAVAMEKVTMGIMLFLVVVVAAFNILSALSMMVSARLSEIAILKTLGLNNIKILTIFLFAGLFVGFIGTLIGVAFGIPATKYVAELMSGGSKFASIPIAIETSNILLIALCSMLMSLIFTIYPAIKASKSDPVNNLCRG